MSEHEKVSASEKKNNISNSNQTRQIPLLRDSHPADFIQRAQMYPQSLTHADVMLLQHTIGNQAVVSLMKEIGLTNENPEPVQMKSKEGFKHPENGEEILSGPIQKKENNTGLPDNLKTGAEKLSGFSLDDVRVHYNSPKPAQLGALAYTQGTETHIAPTQEKYLPHEAWHVVQQAQGRVAPAMQLKGVNVNDDDGLEREADEMGAKISQMGFDNQESSQSDELNHYQPIPPDAQGQVSQLQQTPITAMNDRPVQKIQMPSGFEVIQRKLKPERGLTKEYLLEWARYCAGTKNWDYYFSVSIPALIVRLCDDPENEYSEEQAKDILKAEMCKKFDAEQLPAARKRTERIFRITKNQVAQNNEEAKRLGDKRLELEKKARLESTAQAEASKAEMESEESLPDLGEAESLKDKLGSWVEAQQLLFRTTSESASYQMMIEAGLIGKDLKPTSKGELVLLDAKENRGVKGYVDKATEFFLLYYFNPANLHGTFTLEPDIQIGMTGTSATSITGNKIPQCGTYADERSKTKGLQDLIPAEKQAEMALITDPERSKSHIAQKRKPAERDGDIPSEDVEMEPVKRRVFKLVRARRHLHILEQVRYFSTALGEMLGLLGVMLEFWTNQDYYNEYLPMSAQQATTATSKANLSNPAYARDRENIHIKMNHVIEEFLIKAYENQSKLEKYPVVFQWVSVVFKCMNEAVIGDPLKEKLLHATTALLQFDPSAEKKGKEGSSKEGSSKKEDSSSKKDEMPALFPPVKILTKEEMEAIGKKPHPGFNAERNSAIYEHIKKSTPEAKKDPIQKEIVPAGFIIEQVHDQPLSEEQQKKWTEARQQYHLDMKEANESLGKWFGTQGIQVAPNAGSGCNCLIISLIQHATGEYLSEHEDEARYFRAFLIERLKVSASGMLHSDDQACDELVKEINRIYGTSINPVFVMSTKEHAEPYVLPLIDFGGANPVVIWQEGFHYEALH